MMTQLRPTFIRFTEQEIASLVGIMDIDSADNEVAENSPANTPVGITIKAGQCHHLHLER